MRESHRHERIAAVNRFLKPVRKVMWMTSHANHAIRPESRTPCMLTTALRLSTAAALPKGSVFPGRGLSGVSDTGCNNVRSVQTGLKGDFGNTGEVVIVHHVANDEHLRMTRQEQSGRTLSYRPDRTPRQWRPPGSSQRGMSDAGGQIFVFAEKCFMDPSAPLTSTPFALSRATIDLT